ncbi:hypothetical protein COS31_03995 [Candidatus Roizmanbacteria bacterium CG02_land_8_20_14_3_00_36_15]|uniref:Uncharacterized protein n=2 Tax=Candidatus Roizmaniibacteriota TaxID=1752723 RepID=A0A2M8KKN2_9BACT|nr:MAG: hypothetical protein COS51_04095 [Candidatus Roizmanbacteria bacterium CG03_land_8_20_14_0_80_36_21]PIV37567.1 MAG: hypothetical protein COS31_03995 [Candidatus Roizmanbacteria bacterium CG02_land_8_20_14_3_00_36_15]PIY70408.1 MAG: hypothetical protein COY89_01190 [Candidatus Roizmanbacteria bacterium CG_4_10_14_0_8_um_filter_36_36]PJA52359.1 MAG: hypothetical protein CO166_05985 [Candidatus Roizmanbacteria bacterium CG_4_9_14_3_um_filter_36_11]PJC81887.1 MAG: hypothetical protein CO007
MRKLKSFLNLFNKKALKIEKRVRFIVSSLVLTFLMFVATFFFFDKAPIFIISFLVAGYFLTYFAIIEGIERVEWFTLFLMPIVLSLAFYLFYFLFPGRWLTRLPFIIIYAISIYANFLIANIFNVKVEKSLQLYRAAFSVNFFFQTLVVFLIFNSIFSFHFGFITDGLVSGVVVFLLSLQLYWSVKMPSFLEREIISYSVLTSLLVTELVVIFSFTALPGTILALFMAASYYSFSGLVCSYLDQRLFRETIREYLFVWGFVFLIMILSMK